MGAFPANFHMAQCTQSHMHTHMHIYAPPAKNGCIQWNTLKQFMMCNWKNKLYTLERIRLERVCVFVITSNWNWICNIWSVAPSVHIYEYNNATHNKIEHFCAYLPTYAFYALPPRTHTHSSGLIENKTIITISSSLSFSILLNFASMEIKTIATPTPSISTRTHTILTPFVICISINKKQIAHYLLWLAIKRTYNNP